MSKSIFFGSGMDHHSRRNGKRSELFFILQFGFCILLFYDLPCNKHDHNYDQRHKRTDNFCFNTHNDHLNVVLN